jgi:hypothetical protein
MPELNEKVESSSTDELKLTPEPSKQLAPISSKTRSNSQTLNRTVTLRSLNQTRSHNGYGCDDYDHDDADESGRDSEAGEAPPEKDEFEVRWEGGDRDPMNPRSLHLARKWAVVSVISVSSLCV